MPSKLKTTKNPYRDNGQQKGPKSYSDGLRREQFQEHRRQFDADRSENEKDMREMMGRKTGRSDGRMSEKDYQIHTAGGERAAQRSRMRSQRPKQRSSGRSSGRRG